MILKNHNLKSVVCLSVCLTVWLSSVAQSCESREPWQDSLRTLNDHYYVNASSIWDGHSIRVRVAGAALAIAIANSSYKLVVAISAANAAYYTEECVCVAMPVPASTFCLADAQIKEWTAIGVASLVFAQEFAVASAVYLVAYKASEQIMYGAWETLNENWFIDAENCDAPAGIVPPYQTELFDIMPPQLVEMYLY